MHIDTADGIITTVTSVSSFTLKHAEHLAEMIADQDPLTKSGWYAKITLCDVSHAKKIQRLQNGEID